MSVKPDWYAQLQSPVAVLYGGSSAEREVSLQSGAAVIAALQQAQLDVVGIDTGEPAWVQKLQASGIRHAFIALHGGEGEDGSVQALLKILGISFTGSNTRACALALDKVQTKFLWRGIGLPTADFVVLDEGIDWQAVINRLGKVIVKPALEGSSIGMSIATTAQELEAAFKTAQGYQDKVLAEAWLDGAEFTVAILGDRALPAIRLETANAFYDYEAKYLSEQTRYLCPCGLSAEDEQQLQSLALEAFASVGCAGWGRIDFMQHDGRFQLLEVNTVPGMTSHSLVPMAAKAAGIDFENLVLNILRLSVTSS